MQPDIIPLESIQIATPCRANWNAMQRVQGSDCTRFCPSCGKNVYNLSAMTRDEATRLIQEKEGKMCVRLHRRSDGTVLTSDCPVGKSVSQKRSWFAQLFASAICLGAALFGLVCILVNRSNEVPDSKPSASDFFVETTGIMAPVIPTPLPQGQSQPPTSFPPQTEYYGNASGDAPGADITTH